MGRRSCVDGCPRREFRGLNVAGLRRASCDAVTTEACSACTLFLSFNTLGIKAQSGNTGRFCDARVQSRKFAALTTHIGLRRDSMRIMSYDLMVCEPGSRSRRPRRVLWTGAGDQTKWSEDHGYDDPALSSDHLRAWFEDIIRIFPPMNELVFESCNCRRTRLRVRTTPSAQIVSTHLLHGQKLSRRI